MARIVHFEFHSTQPEKTLAFFRDVFGWESTKWEGGGMPYWLLSTGPKDQPGIDGGLLPSQDGQPRTVCTLEVNDVDSFTKKTESAGGERLWCRRRQSPASAGSRTPRTHSACCSAYTRTMNRRDSANCHESADGRCTAQRCGRAR